MDRVINDVPTTCVENKPTPQSVLFADTFINLSEISRETGLDRSYLSRVFSGKQAPSLKVMKRVADALSMTLSSFIVELENLKAATLDK